ncbi:MAG: DMT family transporter [Clostridiales bacterium]|jgi:drug/metabolite transporter (DMT)-like permease|nr:DMT family transporter [Clostridiales bacterium]
MTKERRAAVEMLLCALMWSLGALLLKLIPWHPFAVSGIRSLIAGGVLLVYMRLTKTKLLLSKKTVALSLVVAAIFVCYVPAARMTNSANAVVLQYTAPVYVLAFGALRYKRRPQLGDALVGLFTIVGVALFFFDQLAAGSFLGNMLALASGIFLAAIFFIGGGVTERERFSGLFLGQMVSMVIGLPFVFTKPMLINTDTVLCILTLGVVQLGIPYILYVRASRHCRPFACSLLSVIEPLLSPIWIYVAIGEAPGMMALYGSIVVLVSVTVWSVWQSKKDTAPQAQDDPING